MRVDFEQDAKDIFMKAKENGENTVIALENFMSDCIDRD